MLFVVVKCMYYCCVQVDASVSVNPIEFDSTDARQRGLCRGKGGIRQKSGSRLATAFTTPLTPIPSGNSASEGEGKKSKKGEKTKTKKRVSPPVTPVVDGATGGHGGMEVRPMIRVLVVLLLVFGLLRRVWQG